MLVKQLRKHCQDPKLARAEEAIDAIATLIDRKAKEAEAAHGVTHMVSLIEGLPANVVSAHRKYLTQVDLQLNALSKPGVWKERTAFLFNDLIIWTERHGTQYAFVSATPLSLVKVEEGRSLGADVSAANKAAQALAAATAKDKEPPSPPVHHGVGVGGFLNVFRKKPHTSKDKEARDSASSSAAGTGDATATPVEFPEDCVAIHLRVSEGHQSAGFHEFDLAIVDRAKRDQFFQALTTAVEEQQKKDSTMSTLRDQARRHRRTHSAQPTEAETEVFKAGKDEGGFGLAQRQSAPQQGDHPSLVRSRTFESAMAPDIHLHDGEGGHHHLHSADGQPHTSAPMLSPRPSPLSPPPDHPPPPLRLPLPQSPRASSTASPDPLASPPHRPPPPLPPLPMSPRGAGGGAPPPNKPPPQMVLSPRDPPANLGTSGGGLARPTPPSRSPVTSPRESSSTLGPPPNKPPPPLAATMETTTTTTTTTSSTSTNSLPMAFPGAYLQAGAAALKSE